MRAAVGEHVKHVTLGVGVITSHMSAGWSFVKFEQFSGSRACENSNLEAAVHEPMNDDGAVYCGWTGDAGTVRGCGEAWPCSSARTQVG